MIRNLLSRRTTSKTSSAAPQEVAGGEDVVAPCAAEQQSHNLHTTSPTGQAVRPINPKKFKHKFKGWRNRKQQQQVDTSPAPSCGGPLPLSQDGSNPLSDRSTSDQESKVPTVSSSDGVKTSSEDTGGLDESTVTITSIATKDTHSRASSGASADSFGQADDATVERFASPASCTPTAAGKVGPGPSPKSPLVKKTIPAEHPKVEGTAAASEADPWNKYFRGWLQSMGREVAQRLHRAPPPRGDSPTPGSDIPPADPVSRSSSSSSSDQPPTPPAPSPPTCHPCAEGLRAWLRFKRRCRLPASARTAALGNALSLMSLSRQTPAQAITRTSAGTAFDPTELANGIHGQTAKVQGLLAQLEGIMSEMRGLQERREQLQLNYAREEDAQAARDQAKQELAAYHTRVTEVEKELADVRGRKEQMEATYRRALDQVLQQVGEANRELGREQARSEELGRDKAEALETATRLRDQLRGLRAKEGEWDRELAALQIAREEMKALVADCAQHVQVAKAKAREEKARADKAEAEARDEKRRADEAEALAAEERRRAEEAQAQAQAAAEQRQASDAQAAHAKTALQIEAQGRQTEAEQIDALQAQIAQLTQQLQQTQAELLQAQAETKRAEDLLEENADAARRVQAGDVLVYGRQYKGLINYLAKRGIEVHGRNKRGNKYFDRLHGKMAGNRSVPVTIRLYLAQYAEVAQAAANDLNRRKADLSLTEVDLLMAGDEHQGICIVVLIGMNSNHDSDGYDLTPEPEGEGEEGQGTGWSQPQADHYNLAAQEMWQVQEGEEGSEDALPLKAAVDNAECLGILGAGGFGVVLRWKNNGNFEMFCIKVQVLNNWFSRQGVVMERRLGQLLHDAYYSITFQTAWIGARYSIARMPFLEGSKALDKVMAEGYFNEGPQLANRLDSVMKQLLDAVKELQSMGVAHRDLKPANILMIRREDADDVNDFGIKMIDFGCATDRCDEVPVWCAGSAGYRPVEATLLSLFPGLFTGVYVDLFAVSRTMLELLPLDLCLSMLGNNTYLRDLVSTFGTKCQNFTQRVNQGPALTVVDYTDMQDMYSAYPTVVSTMLEALVVHHPEVISLNTAKAIAIGLRYKREQRLPMLHTAWDDLVHEPWLPAA